MYIWVRCEEQGLWCLFNQARFWFRSLNECWPKHKCCHYYFSSWLELSAWKGGCSWWRKITRERNTGFFKGMKQKRRLSRKHLTDYRLSASRISWRLPRPCLPNTSRMEEMERDIKGMELLHYLACNASVGVYMHLLSITSPGEQAT